MLGKAEKTLENFLILPYNRAHSECFSKAHELKEDIRNG
jgi:hypothetical protein